MMLPIGGPLSDASSAGARMPTAPAAEDLLAACACSWSTTTRIRASW